MKGEMSGADALAATLFQCDMDDMDQKLAGCLEDMDMRVKTLEQAVLSGEGKEGSRYPGSKADIFILKHESSIFRSFI